MLTLHCAFGSTHTADIPSQQRLWSCTIDSLFVPAVRLSTVGCRAFPVTLACIWNNLPLDITSSPVSADIQAVTKRALISSVLFRSHLWAVQTANCFLFVVLEAAVCYLDWLIDSFIHWWMDRSIDIKHDGGRRRKTFPRQAEVRQFVRELLLCALAVPRQWWWWW